MEDQKIITRDYLAIERTRLANERTFLAYFRTFAGILSAGIAIVKLDLFFEMKELGFAFVIISPFILAVGTYRLIYVRNKMRQFHKNASSTSTEKVT